MSPPKKGKAKLFKPKKGTSTTSLAKRVKKIEAKDKMDTVYYNYGNVFSQLLGTPYNVFHLSNLTAWTPIFGSQAGREEESNKTTYKGLGLDLYFRANNETAQTTFTVFLVSITDLYGQNFNVATGALGLTAGYHYYANGSQVLLNKRCFKIHKSRRFTLGNNGTALVNPSAQTQYGTDKRIYMKVKKNQVFNNPYGNWKDLYAPLDPNKNMYLLVFNDNVLEDGKSPALNMSVVHTVQQMI
jgi:hypothetical protein